MRRRSGFTLIELMIVLAIIAALAAILTPMGLNALNRAQATQLIADVRNVRSAVQVYYFDKKKVPADIFDKAEFGTYLDVDELTEKTAFTYGPDSSNTGAFTLTLTSTVTTGVRNQIPNVWTQGGYSTTGSNAVFSFDFGS